MRNMNMDRTYKQIKTTILDAINVLKNDLEINSLTDLFLVVNESGGELLIYDDEEHILAQNIIEGWDSDDNIEQDIIKQLRTVIEHLDEKGIFESLDLFKPFSINLTNKDFSVQEELLLIDDDSIVRLDDDFMNRMDKEFNEFLDKLLND